MDNIKDFIDKFMLAAMFIGICVVVIQGKVDHDTAEWLKLGGSTVLGGFMALITGNLKNLIKGNNNSTS